MGHRNTFNIPKIFENESDQGWNHAEQPYIPIARGAPESSSIIHPVDNMTVQGGPFPPQWTPTPRSNGYSSSIPNLELSQYQLMPTIAPVPSRGLLPPPASGNPHMFRESYPHHPPSSSIGGQTVTGMDSAFYNQTVGSGRAPYKRKSPSIPPMFERGSTSRYYDVGSSSDNHLPEDPWEEKQITESYNTHWDYPPSYGGNSLSIGGEGCQMRNVRSRSAVVPETNLARINSSSNNSLHHSFSNQPPDQSNSVDLWGQSSNAPSCEWNHNRVAPAAHGVTFGSDSSFFSYDPHPLNTMNSHPNSSVQVATYNNDITLRRNHAPQDVSSNLNLNQSVRGVRTGFGQRSAPNHRASSSNFRHGQHIAAPDEGQRVPVGQRAPESYHLSYPRANPNLRLRNVDRNVRTCMPSDRYRHYHDEASFHDRLTPEGLMVADNNAFYGSRTMLDQHRDMRLDIDNMGYEDLLALGERIGSVNTGLSDNLISKCLVESIYCSSDPSQDEGTCVICLEEYKDMDDVGTLKGCRHDFHVGCIRKWLSMKNSCPICKAAAVDDKEK